MFSVNDRNISLGTIINAGLVGSIWYSVTSVRVAVDVDDDRGRNIAHPTHYLNISFAPTICLAFNMDYNKYVTTFDSRGLIACR